MVSREKVVGICRTREDQKWSIQKLCRRWNLILVFTFYFDRRRPWWIDRFKDLPSFSLACLIALTDWFDGKEGETTTQQSIGLFIVGTFDCPLGSREKRQILRDWYYYFVALIICRVNRSFINFRNDGRSSVLTYSETALDDVKMPPTIFPGESKETSAVLRENNGKAGCQFHADPCVSFANLFIHRG